jgi:hypothetical protein
VIAGQKTLLARDMHDIRYDAVHDEMFVTNPRAQAILVFRGGASGDEPPIRVIQGPHTQLLGPGDIGALMDHLEEDPIHNEIFVPTQKSLLVFNREAQGDAAPIRVIRGSDTQLDGEEAVAVDPVHDLLIAGTNVSPWEEIGGGTIGPRFTYKPGASSLLIFNRTDTGNVKPRAVVRGPRTELTTMNQLRAYPPKGWIFVTQPGIVAGQHPFVGVWSTEDSGDVPPRFRIGGPKSGLKRPRGVVLDPKHKEVFVADGTVNGVLTYYVPEIF